MDVHALRDGTALLSLLAQHLQVRGVIFGHIHQAYYGNWAQMQLWGTPSTCVQFVPGSLQFTLDPSTGPTARWLFLANDGTIGTELFTTSPC
jgi:Icc protein